MLTARPEDLQNNHNFLLNGPEIRWEGGHRPKRDSLWLLPSGPDQVGEAFARAILSRLI